MWAIGTPFCAVLICRVTTATVLRDSRFHVERRRKQSSRDPAFVGETFDVATQLFGVGVPDARHTQELFGIAEYMCGNDRMRVSRRVDRNRQRSDRQAER